MALLVAVVVTGIALATTGKVWSTVTKREKEEELLFRGGEFVRAIGSFYEMSPGVPVYPKSLDDLLKDERQPSVVRHLRKIYTDPMTGTDDWVIVKGKGGALLGVRSSSDGRPLKTGNFPAPFKGFEGKSSYSDWVFVFEPKKAPAKASASGGGK